MIEGDGLPGNRALRRGLVREALHRKSSSRTMDWGSPSPAATPTPTSTPTKMRAKTIALAIEFSTPAKILHIQDNTAIAILNIGNDARSRLRVTFA
jgi:hypothetical protein